jgi:hypothetical protein
VGDGTELVHVPIDGPNTRRTPIRDQANRPFSLHLLEWVRTGPGWWGAFFGCCPCIGEGEIDGHSWFFRARGERWHFCVGSTSMAWAEDEYAEVAGAFYIHGRWTHPELNAGYMSDDDAWALIESGFATWRAAYALEMYVAVAGWEGEGGR